MVQTYFSTKHRLDKYGRIVNAIMKTNEFIDNRNQAVERALEEVWENKYKYLNEKIPKVAIKSSHRKKRRITGATEI